MSKGKGPSTGFVERKAVEVRLRVGVTIMVGASPVTVLIIVTGGRP